MVVFGNILVFDLFGEILDFLDVVYCECIWDWVWLYDWVIVLYWYCDLVQILLMEQGEVEVSLDGRLCGLCDGQFVYIFVLVVYGFCFWQGVEGMVLFFLCNVFVGLCVSGVDLDWWLLCLIKVVVNVYLIGFGWMLVQVFVVLGSYCVQMLVVLLYVILIIICEIDRVSDVDSIDGVLWCMLEFYVLVLCYMVDRWWFGDYVGVMLIIFGYLNWLCGQVVG